MKAVVFDMDGVILDSEALVISCWEKIAEKYSMEHIREVCMECMGTNSQISKEIFLKHYGQEFPYDEYKKEMADLFHSIANNGGLLLKKGVFELLKSLKEHHYKIGLASSTRREIVEAELSQTGVLHFFDAVVCGDMVRKSKPDPEIFLTACEKLQVSPEEAYGIEDSYNGIKASNAAGLKTIMVPDILPPTKEMEELCEVILESLLEVKENISVNDILEPKIPTNVIENFEQIIEIPEFEIKNILSQFNTADIVKASMGASPTVNDFLVKIFPDIDFNKIQNEIGRIKITDVEDVQNHIVEVINRKGY